MTDLPVINPSAVIRAAVASQVRIALEDARTWASVNMGDPEAFDQAADRLMALADDALLDAYQRFIDREGVLAWLDTEVAVARVQAVPGG